METGTVCSRGPAAWRRRESTPGSASAQRRPWRKDRRLPLWHAWARSDAGMSPLLALYL